ncbi:MAG TPA: hypothetical protein DDX39_07530 [Bacteroidales bacterium]|nr:MAG: hypothetical protein A2W98_12325 [Bacteroidetes bacterium GWF2_33_38]OFY73746.1 MAG: hypothetical protein A2265_10425 [Bacteroidetes bacterium RIFOXYA12_FULL_33_9]OFY92425.1 MAG: hypothetical protein A2236_13380 [Bacteroidetes bacterium RIFOXYA2_FULL_33_7]HBF88475.1 hypothetical protein [Bacteroidales bacterium]
MRKLSLLLGAFLLSVVVFGQAVKDRNVIPVAVNLNQVLRMTITNGGNIEFVFNSIDDYKYGLSADVADLQNAQDPEAGASAANLAATTGPGTAVATNFYKTDFTVSSSTRWRIEWGAEENTFIGTDDPGNTLELDNVGFTLENIGSHNFEATATAQGTTEASLGGEEVLYSGPTDNATSVTALVVYPAATALIEDNDDFGDGLGPDTDGIPQGNAGDASENSFELLWRCGTTEAGNVAAPGPYNLDVVPMNAASLLNQGDINPDRYVVNVVFELATDF